MFLTHRLTPTCLELSSRRMFVRMLGLQANDGSTIYSDAQFAEARCKVAQSAPTGPPCSAASASCASEKFVELSLACQSKQL